MESWLAWTTLAELPCQAIQFCLRQAGINLADVEAVGYSFNPPKHIRNVGLGEPVRAGDWGSEAGEETFQRGLRAIPEALGQIDGASISDRFHWIDHHLCHAASAFLVSSFHEAAVLVVDGIGEFATAWLWCQRQGGGRSFVLQHPYLGPGYSDAELMSALDDSGFAYRRSSDPASEAAALIASGAVVGWFQGRMEAGPRALGGGNKLRQQVEAGILVAGKARARSIANGSVRSEQRRQPPKEQVKLPP